MLVNITIEVIVLYNETLRRRIEEEEEKVEIREVFSLQLKEIHIHVIFTFWKKSLVAEENFSLLIPDIFCFIDFILHCRTCSWLVFSYNRKILAT